MIGREGERGSKKEVTEVGGGRTQSKFARLQASIWIELHQAVR